MKKYKRLMVLLVLGFVSVTATANETTADIKIIVESGNVSQYISALLLIASLPEGQTAYIEIVDTGEDFYFGSFEGTDRATPPLNRTAFIGTRSLRRIFLEPEPGLTANIGHGEIGATGSLTVSGNLGYRKWHSNDNGGVFRIQPGGTLKSTGVRYANNASDGSGGVVDFRGTGLEDQLWLISNFFENNSAGLDGGVLNIAGEAKDSHTVILAGNNFRLNSADRFGNVWEADLKTSGLDGILDIGNSYIGKGAHVDNRQSTAYSFNNIFWVTGATDDAINTTGWQYQSHNIIGVNYMQSNRLMVQKSVGRDKNRLLAVCNDFGTNSFASLGYNIAPDDSCALDHPTDLPNTDPLVGMDAAGTPILLPGSPAIDGGSAKVWQPVPGVPLILPCPYIDLNGKARPQDANGDGVFECDIGPVEVQGAGAVSSAHSASFFNNLRNGEGTFVELLAGGLAVIYTFTYTPDGSAPAWITTLGHVVGNSIISNGLTITSGTRFGDNFVAADVVRTGLGEMSMVFPDCETGDNKGSVAYTGSLTLGYEALMTRSTRLTNIIGCDGVKSANAGRSGSFFNAARDGEGIIVQWLADGRVVVMFFTYGLDGGQMWIFGVGTPNGATVTLDAVYPTGLSKWGSGFDPADVVLSPWGTITLTYIDPNNLTFKYNSTVAGYGTNTRNYTRLTNLIDVQ